MDFYERFKDRKKNMENHQTSKRTDRRAKKADKNAWWDRSYETSKRNTEAYRENFDRLLRNHNSAGAICAPSQETDRKKYQENWDRIFSKGNSTGTDNS